MPYVVWNPEDGQVVAPVDFRNPLTYRSVSEDYELVEGEHLLEDDPLQGQVWDATNQKLRSPTDTELAQKELDGAKYEKQVEFFIDFLLERINANPEVVGDYSNISIDLLLKGILSILFDFLKGQQEPTRLQDLGEEVTKLLTKRQNVQSKTLENSTPEEIRAESWQNG